MYERGRYWCNIFHSLCHYTSICSRPIPSPIFALLASPLNGTNLQHPTLSPACVPAVVCFAQPTLAARPSYPLLHRLDTFSGREVLRTFTHLAHSPYNSNSYIHASPSHKEVSTLFFPFLQHSSLPDRSYTTRHASSEHSKMVGYIESLITS